MSKVQEFLKKVAEDKALQEKMTAIMEGKPEEIGDKVVALAKECGYEITFDEFLKEVKVQEGEVSDDEIEQVSGGYTGDRFEKEDYSRAGIIHEHNFWEKDRYYYKGTQITQKEAEKAANKDRMNTWDSSWNQ